MWVDACLSAGWHTRPAPTVICGVVGATLMVARNANVKLKTEFPDQLADTRVGHYGWFVVSMNCGVVGADPCVRPQAGTRPNHYGDCRGDPYGRPPKPSSK